MPLNRSAFFAAVRPNPFGGTLSQSQVDGMNAILDACPAGLALEPLAYCFATAFHETARTMQPIEEYGKGKGKSYGPTGFWGRGLVQLTWEANYRKAGAELGFDLVGHPELALRPDIAAPVMFRGMTQGWFTGKKLVDYFGPGRSDPVNARRIINGTDKADTIAGYHKRFVAALQAAAYVPGPAAAPPATPAANAPAAQPAKSGGFFSGWLSALSPFGRKAS